uniref:Putative DNA binding, helix-turn-helix domain containing protein n=1 Tax=viral metagenome TaxID=1070528 RepID=A0A6H1Z8D9_9ZZZZ
MGRGKLTPEQVKTIRERLGMTQQELATACDMTLSSVSRWERGIGVPSRVATRTIKEVLRRHYLDFDKLWDDEKNEG